MTSTTRENYCANTWQSRCLQLFGHQSLKILVFLPVLRCYWKQENLNVLPFACLGAVVQCSGVVFKLVQSESSYLHCIGMGKEVLLLEPYSVQCTVYRVQFIVYSVQCTVYSFQCTVYSVQCTVNSVQCTVYSLQCTKKTSGQENYQPGWPPKITANRRRTNLSFVLFHYFQLAFSLNRQLRPTQSISSNVRLSVCVCLYELSAGTRNGMPWRLLVKERIAKIIKQRNLFVMFGQ